MAQSEILDKLKDELENDIQGEPQVIYILSRIRKLLEVDGQQKDYELLKFYCDWTLHVEINNTRPMAIQLQEFIEGKDGGKFLQFDYLVDELRKLIEQHGLPKKLLDDKENYLRFINFLVAIYSDTPLHIDGRTITVHKPKSMIKDIVFAIDYSIK